MINTFYLIITLLNGVSWSRYLRSRPSLSSQSTDDYMCLPLRLFLKVMPSWSKQTCILRIIINRNISDKTHFSNWTNIGVKKAFGVLSFLSIFRNITVFCQVPSLSPRQDLLSSWPHPPPQMTFFSMVWKYLWLGSSASWQCWPVDGTKISAVSWPTRYSPPTMISPEYKNLIFFHVTTEDWPLSEQILVSAFSPSQSRPQPVLGRLQSLVLLCFFSSQVSVVQTQGLQAVQSPHWPWDIDTATKYQL